MTIATLATSPRRDSPAPGLVLSVVIPYFRYDVAPLARRLIEQAAAVADEVEIVFLDDGSPESRWHEALLSIVAMAQARVCAGRLAANVGRSAIRNQLLALARAPYLLYLDSDMWPDHDDFLARYVAWARAGQVDVVYGGRSVATVTLTGAEFELHRVFTAKRESQPAQERRRAPAMSFYSCNFLVRRSVLEAFPLDERFTGWGWEDVEWAARVAARHPISHEDNPASHLGLLTVEDIMAKYRQSLGNFQLMLAMHPALVHPTALYRAAVALRRLHLGGLMARVTSTAAALRALPLGWRLRALMLYKASLYARVV